MTVPRRASRRSFFRTAGAFLLTVAGADRAARAAAFDPYEKNIGELQAAMRADQLTSAQLVQFYLDRIAAYDQAGPRLNAVLYVNPNAAGEARALDAERRRHGPRGPLHGIPVLLKDNFDTKDMPTTGGALALSGIVPRGDAFQVRKLRRAGVVILGKVNLHELALGLTTISSLGGQTLDPYDPARAPGGSSGGSGVAVAANFAAFAMGTDTSGSIRIPSSHNSLVGLRPSAGLSSRSGIIPFGHTQDTGGPMARTVSDIALVLDATVGYDPADPVTRMSKGRIPATYTASLKRNALGNARIGVLNQFFGDAVEDREAGVIVRRAIDDMRALGATAIDVEVPNLAPLLMASNLLVQELKFYLGDYLKRTPGARVTSVEELLASGLHAAQLQGFLEGANTIAANYLTGDEYKMRLAARTALGQAITKVMDDNRLDAIVYPTARRIAPLVGGNQIGSNAGLSAQTGFPAITVPAGFTPGGFPVGIELLGRAFAEPTLLGLAFAYEHATGRRSPPSSTPALGGASMPVALPPPSTGAGEGAVSVDVTATRASSAPASAVPFAATARFTFDPGTRQLGYDVTLVPLMPLAARAGLVPLMPLAARAGLPGAWLDRIGGVYLHRRVARPNGGVAFILAKSPSPRVQGRVTLSDAEATDLRAGKFYLSVASRKSPLANARADLVFP